VKPAIAKRSSIIEKFNNLWNPVPVDEEAQGVILGNKECYAKAKPGEYLVLRWTVQNQSTQQWPKNHTLRNYHKQDVFFHPISMPARLKPGEIQQLEVHVSLPTDLKGKDKLIMLLGFEDAERYRFGHICVGIIDIEGEENVFEVSSLAEEGKPQEENVLFQGASQLADEGYGEFSRCLQVLRACKGSLDEARQVLSEIMFKEFKM